MNSHRIVTAGLIATLAIGSIAPAALADHGHFRYRGWSGRGFQHVGYGSRVIVRERSSGGSALGAGLVGLVGGLALGTLLSNSHPQPAYVAAPPVDDRYAAPSRPACVYEDPWTRDRYPSLDAYLYDTRGADHPAVVRVLDARDGDVLQTIAYRNGHWSQCDPDEAPGYGRGDDSGGYDPGPSDRDWQDGP